MYTMCFWQCAEQPFSSESKLLLLLDDSITFKRHVEYLVKKLRLAQVTVCFSFMTQKGLYWTIHGDVFYMHFPTKKWWTLLIVLPGLLYTLKCTNRIWKEKLLQTGTIYRTLANSKIWIHFKFILKDWESKSLACHCFKATVFRLSNVCYCLIVIWMSCLLLLPFGKEICNLNGIILVK